MSSVTFTGDVTNESDGTCTIGQATYSDVINVGTCLGSHIITRTWHLVDNAGNVATDQIQTITVKDNISPAITGTMTPLDAIW